MATTTQKKSQKPNTQNEAAALIYPFVGIIACFFVLPLLIPPMTPAATKPYATFEEFFPFYMSQHEDETCRRLHIIGTTIILLFALFEPFTFPSLLMAGMVGSVLFQVTRASPTGLTEGLAMILTFLYFMRRFTGNWKKGLVVPIVAYTFAWVGHFFFEHNRPATFIYPFFSLMGDFRMCFETYSMLRKF
jgi:hypothetical protein